MVEPESEAANRIVWHDPCGTEGLRFSVECIAMNYRVEIWYAAVPCLLWSLLTLAVLHLAALRRFIGAFSTLYLCRTCLDVLVSTFPLLIATSKGPLLIEPTDMLEMASLGAMLPLMVSAAYSYCIALVMKEKDRVERLNSISIDSADLPYTDPYTVRETTWHDSNVGRVATYVPPSVVR